MSPTPRLGASGKCNGLDSFFDSKNTVSPSRTSLITEGVGRGSASVRAAGEGPG